MNKPTLILLTHGTYGKPKDFLEYTKDLFLVEFNECEIYTFDWSTAHLCHKTRDKAAERLAEDIRKWRKEFPTGRILSAGFSHGGNVLFLLGRYLDPEELPDLIITLGAPMMGYYDLDYTNVSPRKNDSSSSYWINVTSDNDIIQWIGSLFTRLFRNDRSHQTADVVMKFNFLSHGQLLRSRHVWVTIMDYIKKHPGVYDDER